MKKIVDVSQGIMSFSRLISSDYKKELRFICKDILGFGGLRKQVAKDNIEQRC